MTQAEDQEVEKLDSSICHHQVSCHSSVIQSIHYYGRPAYQMRTLYFCPVVSIFYPLFLFLA